MSAPVDMMNSLGGSLPYEGSPSAQRGVSAVPGWQLCINGALRCAKGCSTHDRAASGTRGKICSGLTCSVAELLWFCFDEGPNGPETLQHCLGIITLPEQGCCVPQLQGTALLLKTCIAYN